MCTPRAEEQHFFPDLLRVGTGAAGMSPKAETEDTISDDNDIRDPAAVGDREVAPTHSVATSWAGGLAQRRGRVARMWDSL